MNSSLLKKDRAGFWFSINPHRLGVKKERSYPVYPKNPVYPVGFKSGQENQDEQEHVKKGRIRSFICKSKSSRASCRCINELAFTDGFRK
jgi:hypothetical protein